MADEAGEIQPPTQCTFEGEPAAECWPGRIVRCGLPEGHDGMHMAVTYLAIAAPSGSSGGPDE